jgi:hypothetical protein
MSTSSDSAAVEEARRALRRLVNFGVVSVARVTGVGADQLLGLRCECGVAGCGERIRITERVYGTLTDADLLVVSSLHAASTAERGERWFAVAQPLDGAEDRVGPESSGWTAQLGRAADVDA